MRLEGRHAIVTGAGRGIGRAIALAYAREGADVCVVSRTEAELLSLAGEIEEAGAKALVVRADVSDENQVRSMVDRTLDRFGSIDILVNNAGIIHEWMSIAEMSLTEWRRVLSINLDSIFLCCHYIMPHMLQQGSGHIINLSSIGGVRGRAGRGAYRASKAAIISLTETLGEEARDHGIHVNCINPSLVHTPMMDQFTKGNLPPDCVPPEQMADVAVFLASDESHAFHGSILNPWGSATPDYPGSFRPTSQGSE